MFVFLASLAQKGNQLHHTMVDSFVNVNRTVSTKRKRAGFFLCLVENILFRWSSEAIHFIFHVSTGSPLYFESDIIISFTYSKVLQCLYFKCQQNL